MKRASFYLLAAAFAGSVLASCSHDNKFIGSWTASAPTDLTAEIPAATSAHALMSVDFMSGPDAANTGDFYMSWLVDCNQPVTLPDSLPAFQEPYEVSVAATAGVAGTWTRHDDDEIFLAFDMNTLEVDVDPQGVTYSENVLTGAQQPAIDSLTDRTARIWERQLSTYFRGALQRYSKLDDFKVESDGTVLRFEIKDVAGRDRDMTFRRVLNAD